ncbi:hypothetical protein BJ742DRAFT_769459 [Cladochytrium replicatum]|nr:hypothetical protein BJ742DRAFT_769459 [Cladochytrium replicatum]
MKAVHLIAFTLLWRCILASPNISVRPEGIRETLPSASTIQNRILAKRSEYNIIFNSTSTYDGPIIQVTATTFTYVYSFTSTVSTSVYVMSSSQFSSYTPTPKSDSTLTPPTSFNTGCSPCVRVTTCPSNSCSLTTGTWYVLVMEPVPGSGKVTFSDNVQSTSSSSPLAGSNGGGGNSRPVFGTGTIIGIAIGAVALVAVAAIIAGVLIYRRRKAKNLRAHLPPPGAPYSPMHSLPPPVHYQRAGVPHELAQNSSEPPWIQYYGSSVGYQVKEASSTSALLPPPNGPDAAIQHQNMSAPQSSILPMAQYHSAAVPIEVKKVSYRKTIVIPTTVDQQQPTSGHGPLPQINIGTSVGSHPQLASGFGVERVHQSQPIGSAVGVPQQGTYLSQSTVKSDAVAVAGQQNPSYAFPLAPQVHVGSLLQPESSAASSAQPNAQNNGPVDAYQLQEAFYVAALTTQGAVEAARPPGVNQQIQQPTV